MKVNDESFSGEGGFGKREITLRGLKFSLVTLTLHSSISSLSRMGYSLNSVILKFLNPQILKFSDSVL